MMPILSPLSVPGAAVLTTPGSTSDDKVGISQMNFFTTVPGNALLPAETTLVINIDFKFVFADQTS